MKTSFNQIILAVTVFLSAATFFLQVSDNNTAKAYDYQWQGDVSNSNTLTDLTCYLTLRLVGAGQVMMTLNDGKKVTLDKEFGQVQLPCGDEVLLTADPSMRWQFDHWLGVPPTAQQSLTVTIETPADIVAVFNPRSVTYEGVETPFYNRDGELVTRLERLQPTWQPLAEFSLAAATAEAPVIDIWYGDIQSFGQHGTPQEWINILGNVSDKDLDLSTLSYTLNGGEERLLEFGGSGSLNDTGRFANIGDFNIDLDKDELLTLPDTNEVVITATDSLGMQDEYRVTVRYDSDTVWPIPYRIDWDNVASIQDVSQVVDGKWYLEELQDGTIAGVRPLEPGYDRILAIGEGSFDENAPSWTEFEATVPVTVHGYSGRPSLGVVMRWEGHTDNPITCEQPKCGWVPVGGASWYRWNRTDKPNGLSIWVEAPYDVLNDQSGFEIELEETYIWKVQVENNSNGSKGTYRVKVWPVDEPEPKSWLITKTGNSGSLRSGSLLLLAHHVDVTFGDVEICPVGGCPPEIFDVSVDQGKTEATVTWKTDKPATSRVDYWNNSGAVKNKSEDALVTSHNILLSNLEPETTYNFQIYSTDQSGRQGETPIRSFTTKANAYTLEIIIVGQGIVSKDPDKQEYESGEEVILIATPSDSKSYFLGWGMDVGGTRNPINLVITDHLKVQATFEKHKVGDFLQFLPTTIGDN